MVLVLSRHSNAAAGDGDGDGDDDFLCDIDFRNVCTVYKM